MEQSGLPKNIRQIGQAEKEPKIYIEDYVITFARKMAENKERGLAVLLGKEGSEHTKEPIFIKGAVEINGWEDSERIVFDNEIWSHIYEGVQNYFPDMEIVGWMLLRSGQEAGFEGKVNAIQKNNFKENGSVLFVFDKEDKEEIFYRFAGMNFEKQSGYYIYYEKNEPMQSYMIDLFGNKSYEPAGEDKVMEQVRERVTNKEPEQEKRTGNFVYAASTALAAVVLVMGAATLSNYDRMENMEKTLNHISENMTGSEKQELENTLVVETITGTVEGITEEKKEENIEGDIEKNKDREENENENEEKTSVTQQEGLEEKEEQMQTEGTEKKEDSLKENAQDNVLDSEQETTVSEQENVQEEIVAPVISDGNYYVVKKGDTLLTISGVMYGSDEYVEQIKALNQIEDADMIYEGQKLILP